jgi:molybdopterin-guanine dinucleotide biosynthesis protein A
MGTNKALVDFGGEKLIERIARRMAGWFEQVVLVTNEPEAYAFLGIPMVGDRTPGLGPLGGIEAALGASRYPAVFLAACDMPFLHRGLAGYLLQVLAESDADAAVPVVAGRFEPLCAAYARRSLPVVTACLEAGTYKVARLYEQVRVRWVDEAEVARFGPPEKLLWNCNTPEDLRRALSWVEQA